MLSLVSVVFVPAKLFLQRAHVRPQQTRALQQPDRARPNFLEHSHVLGTVETPPPHRDLTDRLADLWVEGVAMSHCVYAIRRYCGHPGPSRFFSMRRGAHRVATVELQPKKGGIRWFVRDVRLSFNRLPGPDVIGAATAPFLGGFESLGLIVQGLYFDDADLTLDPEHCGSCAHRCGTGVSCYLIDSQ